MVAGRVRELAEADHALILLVDEENDVLRVHSYAGPGGPTLVGRQLSDGESVLAAITRDGVPRLIPDLASALGGELGPDAVRFGPAVAVALRSAGGATGVLIALRDKGSRALEPSEVPLLSSFADQAAVAIEFAEKQRTQWLLAVLADRDRIARDLHDHVIQRLFATGLGLQGTLRRAADPDVRSRIQKAVEQLDETVREIRTSIFDLHTSGGNGMEGLRRRLLDTVAELTADATPTPSVRISGAVDTLVPPSVAEHADAVVREALSNALRHARASELTLAVDAGEDLVIRVGDDGIGIPSDVRRSGLANLAERARACRGSFDVVARDTGGTLLTWRVPLP
jgi:signal transduction histidine kinase